MAVSRALTQLTHSRSAAALGDVTPINVCVRTRLGEVYDEEYHAIGIPDVTK
jgi:hypothetical protein